MDMGQALLFNSMLAVLIGTFGWAAVITVVLGAGITIRAFVQHFHKEKKPTDD